jgi:hypothetical protein
MIEYWIDKIEKCGFSFNFNPNSDSHIIFIQHYDNILTDDELSEYISDSLTHEVIHIVIGEMFNGIVSLLFDSIEYLFRNDVLHKKYLDLLHFKFPETKIQKTYQEVIQTKGYESFLNYYSISQKSLIIAKRITSKRYLTDDDFIV